ncbi:ribosome maturation factor RimM [Virgibacillus sp. C22-A2]|uniref:Ribosome maturation factor RimM n=1 Tax=Virgibacillus tibetensis TaxID=3042313 RepID=A0ABU6KC40_9BACI|nr:ribosome maturation factor RimM [Virgibacillus sp. C22-A2]MEC5422716.1 ribosome maturation factor RimM [Virgibacillus sp. C22-A2]
MNKKMFNVGKIVNTHGIRGELKVLRISDFEERFAAGETLFIVSEGSEPMEVVVKSRRLNKGFELILFEGYDNINDVEKFKGSELKITEDQLTELETNEYYYHEIIGCDVFTNNKEKLGTVTEILSPGANDVWVVKQPIGKDILIPYIAEVVTEIDIAGKKVVIKPMEGLLD